MDAITSALRFVQDTVHRDAVVTPAVNNLVTSVQDSVQHYPYALTAFGLQWTRLCGIHTNSLGSLAHPHPIHKSVEIHFLRSSLVLARPATTTVYFMKDEKFQSLQNLNDDLRSLMNVSFVPRDHRRYRQARARPLPCFTENAFFHDALHFLTFGDVYSFFSASPNMKTMECTTVIPAETYHNLPSLHPEIYDLTYLPDDQLLYQLEGRVNGSYTQPLSAHTWLSCSQIVGSDFNLSVSILESHGPFHRFLISRDDLSVETYRNFDAPDSVLLPAPVDVSLSLVDRLVPKEVYNGLISYTSSVRTLRVSDPSGWVRTQSNKPEYSWVSQSAWDQLQHYALSTAAFRDNTRYRLYDSFYSRALDWIKSHALDIRCGNYLLSALFSSIAAFFSCPRRHVPSPPPYIYDPRMVVGESIHGLCSLAATSVKTAFNQRFPPDPTPISDLLWKIHDLSFLLTDWRVLSLASFSLGFGLCFWDRLTHRDPQQVHDNYRNFRHPERWRLQLKTHPFPASSPSPAWDFSDLVFDLPPVVENTLQTIEIHNLPSQPVQIPSYLPPHRRATRVEDVEDGDDDPYAASSSSSSNSDSDSDWYVPRDRPTVLRHLRPFRLRSPSQSTIAQSPALEPQVLLAEPESWSPLDGDNGGSGFDPLPAYQPLAPVNEPHVFPPTVDDVAAELLDGPLITLSPEETPIDQMVPTLANDPSCSGPVVSAADLYPGSWGDYQGSFHVRQSVRYQGVLTSQNCLLRSLSFFLHPVPYFENLLRSLPRSLLIDDDTMTSGYSYDHLEYLAAVTPFRAILFTQNQQTSFGSSGPLVHLLLVDGHYSHLQDPTPEQLAYPVFCRRALVSGGPSQARCSGVSLRPLTRRWNDAIMQYRTGDNTCIPTPGFLGYKLNPARAKNLVSNMKNGYDGILIQILNRTPRLPRDLITRWDALLDQSSSFSPRRVDLLLLEGFAGSGKSHPIKQVLKQLRGNFRLSVPSTKLRAEWKHDMNLPESDSWRFNTWESALLKSSSVLIIDELYKMPRGYLDLILFLDPAITTVICLADPIQGSYHSINVDSTNSSLSLESYYLQPFCFSYQFWTYRSPQAICSLLQVPCLSDRPGFISRMNVPSPRAPLLTSSTAMAVQLSELGHSAITASASQGLTFNSSVQIYVDRNLCNSISNSVALVAVTRSRSSLSFVGDLQRASTCMRNPILRAIYTSTSINVLSLFGPELTNRKIFHSPVSPTDRSAWLSTLQLPRLLRGGSTAVYVAPHLRHAPSLLVPQNSLASYALHLVRSGRVSATPAQVRRLRNTCYSQVRAPLPLSSRLPDPSSLDDVVVDCSSFPVIHSDSPSAEEDLNHSSLATATTRRPFHHDFPDALPSSLSLSPCSPSDPVVEPVYPGYDYERWFTDFPIQHDPNDREKWFRGEKSSQFPSLNLEFEFGSQAPQPMCADHSSRDRTLLLSSIDSRLRFRPDLAPISETSITNILADQLFEAHCRAYRRSPFSCFPFDPVLFIHCLRLNDYNSLTSKSQRVIQANSDRSDPDWRYTFVRIFAKNQQKINESSIFGNWKACQTLALMHDFVLLCFGPVIKYLEALDQRDCPDNIFVLGGKTPTQLSSASKRMKPHYERQTNDYTSFDQSQGLEAQGLEVRRMRQAGFGPAIIDLYVHIKTNLISQFGPLTSMRFTGEPGTYRFNTDYNLAIIYLKHDVPVDIMVFVSGDDSLIEKPLPDSPRWEKVSKFLPIKFKLETTKYGMFCGYYLSHVGAVRSPLILAAKSCISHANGDLDLKLPSYASEFAIGHSLGEDMWQALPPDMVLTQSAVWDLMCRRLSPQLKIMFKLGEPEIGFSDHLASLGIPLSFTSFSTLSTTARLLYRKYFPTREHPITLVASSFQFN